MDTPITILIFLNYYKLTLFFFFLLFKKKNKLRFYIKVIAIFHYLYIAVNFLMLFLILFPIFNMCLYKINNVDFFRGIRDIFLFPPREYCYFLKNMQKHLPNITLNSYFNIFSKIKRLIIVFFVEYIAYFLLILTKH